MVNIINRTKYSDFKEYYPLIEHYYKKTLKALEMEDNYAVSLVICGPITIRRINREYRNIDKVTDVISYSYAGHNKLGSIICAFKDVYLITALQEEQTWIINDKEGIPYEIKDEKGNKMAVIKKEDFWKGVSSYQWIEDKTIYF